MMSIRLFLAKYMWLRGKPPRSGRFLFQYENGDVKCDEWYFGWPYTEKEAVVYWKRINAPIPAPREYITYNLEARLEQGVIPKSFVEYR